MCAPKILQEEMKNLKEGSGLGFKYTESRTKSGHGNGTAQHYTRPVRMLTCLGYSQSPLTVQRFIVIIETKQQVLIKQADIQTLILSTQDKF